MDDSCAVCADSLEWVAYGSCGHREVCSTCVVRLRFVLEDRRCCICKTESPTVFVTKALGDYTRVITDFSAFPPGANEGQVGSYWYHEGSQAYFDDVDHYRMIKAMCKLSCSICDKNAEEHGGESTKRRSRYRNIEQLKGHLFHQHRMHMCSLCLEGRKVFICEQKLYSRSQLNQHVRTGNSEVDGSESERGGFMGHPMCEFCRNPFYGDNELYMHMSTEHYTCHICQRQHPGQYDYFRNYDDLETHFRQEHFLCEDEACLTKKFVVFPTESEMKRHNTIEHGGHMSRSKRNAALQIPTSFRYRRSNDQDQRRGRGRGFRPDPSDSQLSMAIQASLETAILDGGARESSSSTQPGTGQLETSQANRSSNSQEPSIDYSGSDVPLSSRNSNVLEESYFPPLSDRDPPEPTSRYAQAFSQRNPAKLKEEFFPPLPGVKEHSKPKQGVEVVGSSSTLASRLNRGKDNVKALNSARPRSSEIHELGPSNSASFPQLRPMQNQGPATNQVPKASKSARENGFISPMSTKSSWSSVNENRMRHSSSAPNLVDTLEQPIADPVSAAVGKQSLPIVEDVHTANKSLVERIRIGLGNDEERYATFKSISAEYRQGQINTWDYISYVEQFGLMHLMLELARLCPEPQKQKELVDAYNANIRGRGLQENANSGTGTSNEAKNRKKKGKGKDINRVDDTSMKDELADSFLSTVKKLQLNQKHQEEAVEVLSKDGYRRGKSISNPTSNSFPDPSVNSISNLSENLGGAGDGSKKGRKTSKFHRIRLGDSSAAALFDICSANSNPEHAVEEPSNETPSEGLPVRGVWKNSGGQKLFGK